MPPEGGTRTDGTTCTPAVRMDGLRIGELSRRTGVSIRSLRYYEEQGLLRPARGANGYRCFVASDIERVAHIQLLFAAGMRSSCIAAILPCVNGAGPDPYPAPAPDLVRELTGVREQLLIDIERRHQSIAVLDQLLTAALGPTNQPDAHTDAYQTTPDTANAAKTPPHADAP